MTKREETQAARQRREEAEIRRVAGMRRFEQEAVLERFGTSMFPELCSDDAAVRGSVAICGIDEAGRGPLAGPVAAAACILPAGHDIMWLNDSKKLSEKKRLQLYDVIVSEAPAWKVSLVSPQRIDEINILQATYEAMCDAVNGLGMRPDVLVNDAVTIPGLRIPQVPVIRGDAQCLSVAAASILAKVTRDRIMLEEDARYPQYGFARHKGYGTREHIAAIRSYGPCPIHRRTFITHFTAQEQPEEP